MKEGTKVKVTACFTGHEFDIGEVVMRKYLEEEHSETCLGFVNAKGSSWYMSPEEYEICDKVSKSGWISVDEDQPSEMHTVIITDGESVAVGYFSKNGDDPSWSADGYDSYLFKKKDITHWMPLPEPPK